MNQKFKPQIKAIFFDRDGTLIKDFHYNYNIKSQLEILPGAVETMAKLSAMGYQFFIVTNQSGIARGYFGLKDYEKFQAELVRRLAEDGITIEETYFCPHLKEDNCACRKPSPAQINRAIKKYNVDTNRSYFVGDKDEDVLTGKNAGLITVRVLSSYLKEVKAEHEIKEITEMLDIIESEK